jgi:5'-methylthioinosine phosphorylase
MTSIAIIGGTGLADWPKADAVDILAVKENRFGQPSGNIHCVQVNGVEFLFLARHGNPHSIPPHKINYRANMQALKDMGVQQIFAVNAVGGIGDDFGAGAISIAHDIIDYTSGREHTIYDGGDGSLDHIDFTWPYSSDLREILLKAAEKNAIPVVNNGIYACTNGPRLESAAEVNRLQRDGADLIGMTGMPEAALAREMAMNYACLGLVVNPAAGQVDEEITMADIQRVLDEGMGKVRLLLETAVGLLG